MKESLDYDLLLAQFQILKKLGPIDKIIAQIPGIRQIIPAESMRRMSSEHCLRTEAIILSMTPSERRLQAPIGLSRRNRIARGAGTDSATVAELQMKLDEMRRMMPD